MATSSIFHNVVIDTEEAAGKFVNALEQSEKWSKEHTTNMIERKNKMHLEVDTKNYKATLKHGGGMVVGTLEFETYEVINPNINNSTEYIEALEKVYQAAKGLCCGEDWNNGTHVKLHGYKQKLRDAVRVLNK